MLKLEKYVLSEMAEKLREWKGENIISSPDDLTWKLFEGENISGSYTCSRRQAQLWIKEYFKDISYVIAEMEEEWGNIANPFTESECFQVEIILFVANKFIQKTNSYHFANDEVSKEITFTDELIETILEDWESLAHIGE